MVWWGVKQQKDEAAIALGLPPFWPPNPPVVLHTYAYVLHASTAKGAVCRKVTTKSKEETPAHWRRDSVVSCLDALYASNRQGRPSPCHAVPTGREVSSPWRMAGPPSWRAPPPRTAGDRSPVRQNVIRRKTPPRSKHEEQSGRKKSSQGHENGTLFDLTNSLLAPPSM